MFMECRFGVVDSENDVKTSSFILLKDSIIVCEGVPNWVVELRDCRFQKRPRVTSFWKS